MIKKIEEKDYEMKRNEANGPMKAMIVNYSRFSLGGKRC